MVSARKKVNLLRPQPLKNEKEGLLFSTRKHTIRILYREK